MKAGATANMQNGNQKLRQRVTIKATRGRKSHKKQIRGSMKAGATANMQNGGRHGTSIIGKVHGNSVLGKRELGASNRLQSSYIGSPCL